MLSRLFIHGFKRSEELIWVTLVCSYPDLAIEKLILVGYVFLFNKRTNRKRQESFVVRISFKPGDFIRDLCNQNSYCCVCFGYEVEVISVDFHIVRLNGWL